MGSVSTVELMGLPIDGFTEQELIDHVIGQSMARRGGYLMTPNVDNLRSVTRDPELFGRAMAADVRVADGMPLVWASRLQGTPLPARVAGSDLISGLAPALVSSGRTLFLLGGNPGTAERAAETLRARFQGLQIVGTYCPPNGFENDPGEVQRMRAALRGADPDFVYLGLPFDKASALANESRGLLPATWFIGLGISFSFICGDVSRAPSWMQRAGLEWLHRLMQEPGRLCRRYMLEGVPFVARLLLRSFLSREWLPSRSGEASA